MIFQALQKRLLVFPDRQRDALLEDVVVSGGEGLASERVELRRNRLFGQLGENLGRERASGRGCAASLRWRTIRGCLIESTFRMRHQTKRKRKRIESKSNESMIKSELSHTCSFSDDLQTRPGLVFAFDLLTLLLTMVGGEKKLPTSNWLNIYSNDLKMYDGAK